MKDDFAERRRRGAGGDLEGGGEGDECDDGAGEDGPGDRIDLSDPRNRQVFELAEQIFAGWSNELQEGEHRYRSPKNRGEAKRSRMLLEQARALKAPSRLLRMRLEEFEAVLEAIPPVAWKKLIIPILLSLLPFAYLWHQKSASDELSAWVTGAQAASWTVTEDAPLYPDSSNPDRGEQKPAKLVRRGTRVRPLVRSGYFMYQVRLDSGEVGYLHATSLAEGRVLTSRDEAKLYTVNPLENSSLFRKKDIAPDQIHRLPPGAQATLLEMLPNHGGYRVHLPDGQQGWVLSGEGGMLPKIVDEVPIRRHQHARIFPLDRIRALALGHDWSEVEAVLGVPRCLVYDDPASGRGRAEYGSRLVAVDGSRRHRDVVLRLEGRKVSAVEVDAAKARKTWVEALPLASALRSAIDLNGTFLQEWEYQAPRPTSWWGQQKEQHWILALLANLGGLVLGLMLLVFFPTLATKPLRLLMIVTRTLPSKLVIAASLLLLAAASYAYLLLFTLYLSPQEALTLVVPYDGFTAMVLFGLVISYRIIRRTELYHRCPRCHEMYSAIGQGTEHMGTTRSVEWKQRLELQYASRSQVGNVIYVTSHYTRHWDQIIRTRSRYQDHRECAFCHYTWAIQREETSTETIRG